MGQVTQNTLGVAFFIEGRYALGLSDIYDGGLAKVKNRGFQVFSGITLHLGL